MVGKPKRNVFVSYHVHRQAYWVDITDVNVAGEI